MLPPDVTLEVPLWLALATTGVAAIQGAVIGRQSREPRYDIVGAFVLAFVLGLAGGITRDVLIGNLPVEAIRIPWYIAVVIAVTVLVIVAGRFLPTQGGMWFTLLDALTMGLYTAIATNYAMAAGVSVVGAVFVGVAAGIAGGLIVALLRGRTPAVLVPGIAYALTGLAGSIAYVALEPASPGLAAAACVGLVIFLRYLAVRFNMGTRALPLLGDPSDQSL